VQHKYAYIVYAAAMSHNNMSARLLFSLMI